MKIFNPNQSVYLTTRGRSYQGLYVRWDEHSQAHIIRVGTDEVSVTDENISRDPPPGKASGKRTK